MKPLMRDLVGVTGAALVAAGAGLVYLPAGLIVGGLMLVAVALVTARAR